MHRVGLASPLRRLTAPRGARAGLRLALPVRPLAGASVLALAACVSVGPEAALAPVAVPTSWAAVSAERAPVGSRPVTEDWLAEIGDPEIAPLVAEAIRYNNNLAATAARVRATYAGARIQRSFLLPSVSAQAAGSSSRRGGGVILVDSPTSPGQQVPIEVDGSSDDNYNLGFSARWEIDLWGQQLDATRAAYADAEAQALSYGAAALSVAGGTARAFYALTEARLQTQLGERDVETGEANLRIIERRFDRGISSSLDVRLARASLAQSRAQLIGRRQAEAEAARRLEVFLGRYPDGDLRATDALPALAPLVTEDGDLIGAGDPAGILFRRPDVLAAEQRLKAAGLRVSEARKALLPSLSLSASATDQADRIEDFTFDPDAVFAQMIASLVQPLFQGGRIRANIQNQRAQMEAAVYDYAQTALVAFREVEDALAAEAYLTAQADARALAFEEARAAEELTERRYLQGTEGIFNLINAQQRRIANESQLIAAQRARLTNRIDLYLALGAPFEVPRGSAGAEPRPAPRFTDPARDPAASPASPAPAARDGERRGLFGLLPVRSAT